MKRIAEAKLGYKKVQLADLRPNPWNMNKMAGALFEKLETNITEFLKTQEGEKKSLPPIVVRPHPTEDGKYEIIDGFHRYKVYKKLKLEDVDSFVIDVDDAMARILTTNLNYLRGEADPEKYADVLGDLLSGGKTAEDLAKLLPESEEEISDIITVYGSGAAVRALLESEKALTSDERNTAVNEDDVFVDLKYRVSVTQAKIVQREIDRIAGTLTGNNTEGRALEFMAVQSSQTPLEHEVPPPKARGVRIGKQDTPKVSSKDRAKALRKKMKEPEDDE